MPRPTKRDSNIILRMWQMAEPKESRTNRHFQFSLAKSVIRFVGYGCMMTVDIPIIVLAGVLLAGAEVLGILEEI
jgi:hypothetical protein